MKISEYMCVLLFVLQNMTYLGLGISIYRCETFFLLQVHIAVLQETVWVKLKARQN